MLEFNNLRVSYLTPRGRLRAVNGVSLKVKQGQRLGLVGESGCGKSTLAKAALGLLDENAMVEDGRVLFKGRDLLSLSATMRRKILWQEIAYVPQASLNVFNPVYKLGWQFWEAGRLHGAEDKELLLKKAGRLLAEIGLSPSHLKSHPHQLSGGMLQRMLVAMAFILDPHLIVGDEPTTALDVVTQRKVMSAFSRAAAKRDTTLLLISHDLGSLSLVCDWLAVMYAGRIVEKGPWTQVLTAPLHPYTMGLMSCVVDMSSKGDSLRHIPGSPPTNHGNLRGCGFEPRCPFAIEFCRQNSPPGIPGESEGHISYCHLAGEASRLREAAASKDLWLTSRS